MISHFFQFFNFLIQVCNTKFKGATELKAINLLQKGILCFLFFFAMNFFQLDAAHFKCKKPVGFSKSLAAYRNLTVFSSSIMFLVLYSYINYKIKGVIYSASGQNKKNDSESRINTKDTFSVESKDTISVEYIESLPLQILTKDTVSVESKDTVPVKSIESLPTEILSYLFALLFKEYIDRIEEKPDNQSLFFYKFKKPPEPSYWKYAKLYQCLFMVNKKFRMLLMQTCHQNNFFPRIAQRIHYCSDNIEQYLPIYTKYYSPTKITKQMEKESYFKKNAYKFKVEMLKFLKDTEDIPWFPTIHDHFDKENELCKDQGENGQIARIYKMYQHLIKECFFYPKPKHAILYGNPIFIKALIALYTTCVEQYENDNSIKIKILKKLLIGGIFIISCMEHFLGHQFLMLIQKCLFQQSIEGYDNTIFNTYELYLQYICKKYNLAVTSSVVKGLQKEIEILFSNRHTNFLQSEDCAFFHKAYFYTLPCTIFRAIHQFNINGYLNFNHSYIENKNCINLETFFKIKKDCKISCPSDGYWRISDIKGLFITNTILTPTLFLLIKQNYYSIKEIVVRDIDEAIYTKYNVPENEKNSSKLCIDNICIIRILDQDKKPIQQQVEELKKNSINPLLATEISRVCIEKITPECLFFLKNHIFIENQVFLKKFQLLDRNDVFKELNLRPFHYSIFSFEDMPSELLYFYISRLNVLNAVRKKLNNHIENIKENYSLIREKINNSFLKDPKRLKLWMELLIKQLDHIKNLHTMNYEINKRYIPSLTDLQDNLIVQTTKLYDILEREINDIYNDLPIFSNFASTIIIFYSSYPEDTFEYCGGKLGFDYIVDSMKEYSLDYLINKEKLSKQRFQELHLGDKIKELKNKEDFFLTDFIGAISWQPAQ